MPRSYTAHVCLVGHRYVGQFWLQAVNGCGLVTKEKDLYSILNVNVDH